MPRIFDNIEKSLLPALQDTLSVADRADFCVGYFNLRGWQHLSEQVSRFAGGDGRCARLLVGMHVSPTDEWRRALRFSEETLLDNQTAVREKRRIAEEFRSQLSFGFPSNADETTLRQLAKQIHAKKLFVKVYLRHPLHAKLYLLHRQDANNPVTGFLGSSNLTQAGLSKQGELNVDVLEHDACNKLSAWFEDRWKDRFCLDISAELAQIIDESWAGERLIPPYHVYLKMAYHLARDARAGLSEFSIPKIFGDALFDFQMAAVKIAAHHLNKRKGVLIGDVVGLGKSMMATALAKVFEEDYHTEALIICPKNLVSMWEGYVHRYRLYAKVLSLSQVMTELPEKMRRYRLVLIDESHNLRNKEGKRWRVIRDYIARNESLTILLSATPYNKSYADLSAQLGLFLNPETDLGLRPENLLKRMGGESEFVRHHQCGVRTLAAFEKSDISDDWHDLMRFFMVRRTRSFIMANYAKTDEAGRKYLLFSNGNRSYFPKRVPKNLYFVIDDNNPDDPYARFYSPVVVGAINHLKLPRYGLGKYIEPRSKISPTPEEEKQLDDLSRAGTRLMGFCRTNLFKRLESAGPSFILSIERHILRNFVFLYALENNLPIPLGTQGSEFLDRPIDNNDDDTEAVFSKIESMDFQDKAAIHRQPNYRARAKAIYEDYRGESRFSWLASSFFIKNLAKDLQADAESLIQVLQHCGQWRTEADNKLSTLIDLIQKKHPQEKILIFTQFADTAYYLHESLKKAGISHVDTVTGRSEDPAAMALLFSPLSNDKNNSKKEEELRVLIATDVLSEGQNLQDAHIVVNYDLPWAIIRLIQRAGRVDRIGQKSEAILCYSFIPADGVERIIQLRARVKARLSENAEIVGSDERFFDDETEAKHIRDLYTEKEGILDDEDDNEVDLASYAYQIWKNSTDANPSLMATIPTMSDVVYSAKSREVLGGVLVYTRTAEGSDILTWVDEAGNLVTQSQLAILKAAACAVNTPAMPRAENHHDITLQGLRHIAAEEKSSGGALGRRSGARFKAYEKLKRFHSHIGKNRDLFITDDYVARLEKIMEIIYQYPLYETARDSLARQIKSGINDQHLFDLIETLHEEERLCIVESIDNDREPRLICSLGLV